MDKQRQETYFLLLERLLYILTPDGEHESEAYKKTVEEICRFFRLSKGEIEFYRSLSHEKMKSGIYYCGYDDGRADKIVCQIRTVTKTSAVMIGTAYMAADEPPLDEEEKDKVELILRILCCFVRRTRLQNAVEQLGYHDEHGYPNMRSFFRYLDYSYREGHHEGLITLLFNLRHFSVINREIGREMGDKVIRNYVELLKDAISENGIVCRLGGDNFLAVCHEEELDKVTQILRGTPVVFDEENDGKVVVSASAGAYRIPKGYRMINSGEVMDKLIPASMAARADYSGELVFFCDEMLKRKDRQASMQRLFPSALKNREFHVYYQPKINVNTGEIVGAEALCRWYHDGKIIPPLDFIPVLEQNTDICKLDFYMLDAVCKDIRRWLEEGRKVVRISVNFSRKHMLDPNFLEQVLKIVKENDIPHDHVEIELTETTTDVEFLDLKRVVGGLQKEGIATSVDDFGMGYSSLNLIREIPWNVLKIDKSFLPVDGDERDLTTNLMYKHVVAMGNDLGLECITEGVETEKQVEILKENKCWIAQGFYFDKPLPVEEFENRMENPYYKI